MRATENYRADIDGLRALAVLAVMAFHGELLPQGHLGVDVFFAISGYLITQIIHRQLEQGRFSLLDFYERRVRRILPLTLVVSLAALAVGCIVMLPDDLENLAQSVVATNLFANNILQAITTRNYWDVINEYKPLMHTWSLGVEEQYYILYPFLLLAFRGARQRWLLPVLLGLAVASLAACLMPVWAESDKFYHMPFRFWELAVGGLVALKPVRLPPLATGLAVVLLAVLFAMPAMALAPAIPRVLAVLAAAVIVMGAGNGRWASMLGCTPLAWLGRLSFGLYMWHQPLLAYTRYLYAHELTAVVLAALALATLVLAALSHAWVEGPLRDRRRSSRRLLAAAVGALLVVTTLPSLYLDGINGVVRDVPELDLFVSQRSLSNGHIHAQYNDRIYALDREFSAGPSTRVLVVGSSVARDWANVLLESPHSKGMEISYAYTLVPRGETALRRAAQADIVFVVPRFVDLSPMEIESPKTWLLGFTNFGTSNGIFYNHRGPGYLQQRTPLAPGAWQMNQRWRQRAGSRYVDYLGKLVDDQLTVPVFTPDGRFISQDCRHLTRAGARYFATLFDTEIRAMMAAAREASAKRLSSTGQPN